MFICPKFYERQSRVRSKTNKKQIQWLIKVQEGFIK